MFKPSDIFLLIAVAISFIISAYFMIVGDYVEAVFTAVWVPSILCFSIFFKLLGLSAILKDSKIKCCCCCDCSNCNSTDEPVEKIGINDTN